MMSLVWCLVAVWAIETTLILSFLAWKIASFCIVSAWDFCKREWDDFKKTGEF
jgi:hypothetical protein